METFTISLRDMNYDLAKAFFAEFYPDPDLFIDIKQMKSYRYSEADITAYMERQKKLNRIHLAIMRGNEVVGEILLKNVSAERSCTLSIHLKNDTVKNKGYGTEAERQALQYAFRQLKMKTVFADALIKNVRSRHVLEKVGFEEIRRDESFIYYQISEKRWKHLYHIED